MSTNVDAALYGENLFGEPATPPASSILAARFVVPPFSVLDGRAGYWLDRKRQWIGLGIKSELGREGIKPTHTMRHRAEKKGYPLFASDTSVFDPVLCECCFSWFCPPGGTIIDPFAGGSVRGVVASLTGHPYWGCDLRDEQVAANRIQSGEILRDPAQAPVWHTGDALALLPEAPLADLVFTCPPYGDLEAYSDDPRDLSRMSYSEFVPALLEIMGAAAERLRQHRFLVMVVGDFRDMAGGRCYRGFPPDLVVGARALGLSLYNHGVMLTPVGSVAMHASSYFEKNRMLRLTHQDVLVFCKGDARSTIEAVRQGAPEPAGVEAWPEVEPGVEVEGEEPEADVWSRLADSVERELERGAAETLDLVREAEAEPESDGGWSW